ncbi:MAG: hypothetical protein SP1CHLAM54_08230 [Chlamydiia bacterium]|nr:hypothetical protein [Chlamydiia bacterium]MCH9615729.1 hypothetical protein [Chlamydiia bacterium]MCH9628868.1 hypothetical protein [Chlamydiia bacterium]
MSGCERLFALNEERVIAADGLNLTLPGPDQAAINALLQEWCGDRTADNSVVWGLAHGEALAIADIVAGIGQRIVCPHMRRDIDGLGPCQVLALQGRVGELAEVIPLAGKIPKPGGRNLFHMAALAGHLVPDKMRPLMGCLSRGELTEKGDFGGTPKQVKALTGEQTGEVRGSHVIIDHTHIPECELLRMWMSVSLKLKGEERVAVERHVMGLPRAPKESIALVDTEMGLGVVATRDIGEMVVLGDYAGLFAREPFMRHRELGFAVFQVMMNVSPSSHLGLRKSIWIQWLMQSPMAMKFLTSMMGRLM